MRSDFDLRHFQIEIFHILAIQEVSPIATLQFLDYRNSASRLNYTALSMGQTLLVVRSMTSLIVDPQLHIVKLFSINDNPEDQSLNLNW